MPLAYLYLALTVIALVLTTSQMYAQAHGNDWSVFFREPFSTPAMRFITFDLAIAVVALIFMIAEEA